MPFIVSQSFLCSAWRGMFLSVASVVLLAACDTDAEPNQGVAEVEKPTFLFKNFTATTTLEEAQAGELVQECGDDFKGEVICSVTDASIGEAESHPTLTWVVFKDGKLDWFSIEVRRDQYSRARASLETAYGDPCEQGSSTIQNGFGAKFDASEIKWCFADGVLDLSERSTRNLNFAEMTFHPYRETEPATNYSPSDL